jgi:hypothetical protein
LEDFLSNVHIDKSFIKFLDYVKSNFNAKVYILSDGFRLFIKKILKYHLEKIDGIYANNLYFINKNLKPFTDIRKKIVSLGFANAILCKS